MAAFGKRLSSAFRSFFGILGSGTIPDDVARDFVAAPRLRPHATPSVPEDDVERSAPPHAAPPDQGDRAVQILALLQRDGRLVDFLTEDVTTYTDAQIGAAARSVHESCRRVLDHYLKIEPIVTSDEGRPVTLEGIFDPAEIKLVGNVREGVPVRGVLQHKGWRVAALDLPPMPAGAARRVLAQAEVEIP